MPRYSVTISPPYRREDPKQLYEDDKIFIRRHLNKFSKDYCLYPEFSDKGSRLHYHGIVNVHDTVKMHRSKYRLDRHLGFSVFKRLNTFQQHLRALIYAMKEWAANCAVFLRPLMYRKLRRRKPVEVPGLDTNIGILRWCTIKK